MARSPSCRDANRVADHATGLNTVRERPGPERTVGLDSHRAPAYAGLKTGARPSTGTDALVQSGRRLWGRVRKATSQIGEETPKP